MHGYDHPWPAGGGENLFRTTATGKTEAGVTWTVNDDGSITVTGTSTGYTDLAAGNAVVSGIDGYVTIRGFGIGTVGNVVWSGIGIYTSDGVAIGSLTGESSQETFVANLADYPNAGYIRCTLKRNNNVDTNATIKIQVSKGQTAPTSWTPYSNLCPISGHTGAEIYHEEEYDADADPAITVTFPETIYGGKHEVIGGALASTMNMVDMGDIDWIKQTSGGVSWFAKNMSLLNKPMKPSSKTDATAVLLSCYDYIGFGYIGSIANGKCITNDNVIFIRDDSCATEEDFISKVTGQMLCYELAEPVEYTLTGNEIIALDGTNVIWANTGDVAVTYIAKSAKFSFGSPLRNYNYNNLKLFGNTYIEHGKG